MKQLFFKEGQEIIREGTLSNCAYIIDKGKVEVSKTRKNGEKHIIGVLKESEIFGELGLIDGLPRSASVKALEDSKVSIISQDKFESLAQHKPEALIPILKVLAARLRTTLNMVKELQDKTAETPAGS